MSDVFLLSADAVGDRLVDGFRGTDMELIHRNLSAEHEAQLQDAFAEV